MSQPKQRALSRDIILSTAFDLADEEGLSTLSLRSLGKRPGASQVAPYRHLPGRAAFLEGISEQVWCLIFKAFLARVDAGTVDAESTPTSEASAPTDGTLISPLLIYMCTYAHCLASTLRSHPSVVMLLLTHPMSMPEQLSLLARAPVALVRRGFISNADMLGLINAVSIYATVFAAVEVVPPVGGPPEQPADLSVANDAPDPESAQALHPLIEGLLDDRYGSSAQSERGSEAALRDWA